MINISKAIKSFQGLFRPVLNEVNLTLEKGDFCVLIGTNGSGKSTLLKLISGEYSADSGEIRCKGNVAQVTQDINLGTVPEITVLENIALSEAKPPKLLFYNRYRNIATHKLKELGVGLENYIDQPMKMLSGGQKQMVATLIAINSGCKILLLDEHTSALDPKTQVILMDYTTKQIAQRNLTTIMVTHKMDDAIKYGNRLMMMHQGKIVMDIHKEQKQSLTVQNLLTLFYQYEDQCLRSGGNHDN